MSVKFGVLANWAINITCGVVALLTIPLLVQRYWPSTAVVKPVSDLSSIAAAVPMGDHRPKVSIILAMSTTCHFCSESAPFYRTLVAQAVAANVGTIAVLPQPVSESENYVSSLGILRLKVISRPLSELGVRGTPTLITVDENGHLRKAWAGKLTKEQEREVAQDVGLDLAGYAPTVSAVQLRQAIETGGALVLDSRPRDSFRSRHIAGSLNIPVDEMEARAEHEIKPTETVFLVCDAAAVPDGVGERPPLCLMALSKLRGLGFPSIQIVHANFDDLQASGVSTEAVSSSRGDARGAKIP